MSVKSCNIRIPSGLSDAQVAADAACAAKRYAYSAEQVESRLNSYVEDLTGLDLEQIAANTAAAADIVNTVTTARDEAVAAADTVEELAPQVKDMLDTIVEQDLEQLRQDIAVATDLIATVDGKVTAAQEAATDAAGSALRADQSETAAEEALAETWTAYSAVLSEKETAAADFKADADGKVAAAVDAQLNPGGDFYAAVRTAVFDTIPAKVDSYVTEVTSEGGTLYDYVAESQNAISERRDEVIEAITINRIEALDAIDTLQEKSLADIVYSGAEYIDYIAYSGQLAIDAIATAEDKAIASIGSKVDADIDSKINSEYLSGKVDAILPGLIDAELADADGAWNREKTAAIEAATAQAELSQTYAQNAYEHSESAEGYASDASASASAALTSEHNAYSRALDATEQAELAKQWAISLDHVAGLTYSGAMYYATEAAAAASKAATAEDNARSYSIYVREQAELAAEYAQNAYDYSMNAAQRMMGAETAKNAAEQAVIDARAAMNQASDSAQAAEDAKAEAVLQAQQAGGAASAAAGSYNSVVEAYSGVLDAYASTLDAYEATKAAVGDAETYLTEVNAVKNTIDQTIVASNWSANNIPVDDAGAFTVTPGLVYAVWSKEVCAIYKDAALENKLCTIWAEEQRCIMATQAEYYISPIEQAAAAIITSVQYTQPSA